AADGGCPARRRDVLRVGDPYPGAEPADLQPAVVSQRHHLAARQLADRAGARPVRPAPAGGADPGLALRRGAAFPLPAASGTVLRDLARGDGRAGGVPGVVLAAGVGRGRALPDDPGDPGDRAGCPGADAPARPAAATAATAFP